MYPSQILNRPTDTASEMVELLAYGANGCEHSQGKGPASRMPKLADITSLAGSGEAQAVRKLSWVFVGRFFHGSTKYIVGGGLQLRCFRCVNVWCPDINLSYAHT